MEWISIKDKLPDYGEGVLLYSPNTPNYTGRVGERRFTDKEGDHYFIADGSGDKIKWPVTYWMPLPDPPKSTL